MDPSTRSRLKEEVLPMLDRVRQDRRPMRLLLIGITVVPLILAVTLVAHQMWRGDWKMVELLITGAFMTTTGTAFVYLGKLQSCDDVLTRIELVVRMDGNEEHLEKATQDLGCYGTFHGVVEHVRKTFNP